MRSRRRRIPTTIRARAARRPRHRASARSRPMACPPPTARAAPATTRSTASASSQSSIRASRSRSGPPVPARRCRPQRRQRASARRASRRRRPRPRNKTPVPPAMAGTVPGQPLRRRLKVDDDAFGAVGDYAGSFLIKGGLELSTGYDTNPARLQKPVGSPVYVVAPDLLVMSDWERHALVADLARLVLGLHQQHAGDDRRLCLAVAGRDQPPRFHRPCRRPLRRRSRSQADLAIPPAARHRQSRQPERAGRPAEISGLRHLWRHLRLRPDLQPLPGRGRRHHRSHRLYRLQAHRRLDLQQRRPRLQPVWRRRALLLRAEAGPEAVRRDRGRQPRPRPGRRPQRLLRAIQPAAMPRSARPSNSRASSPAKSRSAIPRATMSTRA